MFAEDLASRNVEVSGDGLTGRRSWQVLWNEIEPEYDPYLRGFPRRGDSWPDCPTLRIVNLSHQQVTQTNEGIVARITAQYSTNQDLKETAEEWVEESLRGRLESGQRIVGWSWTDAGTKVTQEITLPEFSGELSITMRQVMDRSATVMSCIGSINDRVFRGVAAGCLQLQDVSQDTKYDPYSGEFKECKLTFSFGVRRRSWNLEWREPLAARTADGRERYWQDQNSAADDYTTDTTLVGTPVYVTGAPGTAAWDTPKGPSDENKYTAIDMASLLGIPIKLGDDAPGAVI